MQDSPNEHRAKRQDNDDDFPDRVIFGFGFGFDVEIDHAVTFPVSWFFKYS